MESRGACRLVLTRLWLDLMKKTRRFHWVRGKKERCRSRIIEVRDTGILALRLDGNGCMTRTNVGGWVVPASSPAMEWKIVIARREQGIARRGTALRLCGLFLARPPKEGIHDKQTNGSVGMRSNYFVGSEPICFVLADGGPGQIDGTVTDKSGGAIAGATVTLTDSQTNIARTATSNDSGRYVFASVAPGVYSLTINKTGFRLAKFSEQEIQVGSTKTLNVTMEIGSGTETIEVTATSADLQTMNATVGNTISGLALNSLPVSGAMSYLRHPAAGCLARRERRWSNLRSELVRLDGGNNSKRYGRFDECVHAQRRRRPDGRPGHVIRHRERRRRTNRSDADADR